MDQFDWTNDPSITVEHQPALAIYTNACGHLVIRREAGWNEEEDSFLTVAPENLIAVLYGMIDAAELPFSIIEQVGGGFADVERPGRPQRAPVPRLALPAPEKPHNGAQPELALNGGSHA